MNGKESLSATNLAVYQHLNCDLYIHNIYNGAVGSSSHSPPSNIAELAKAQFQRGLDWEECLYSWLDRSQLLLTVPSVPMQADYLLEHILADDRCHFYITGLNFWPPQEKLKEKFLRTGIEPLNFGLAKPDLLEIKKTKDGIIWRVIDAKASKHVKTSHHVQIYFYTLCLNYLLPKSLYHGMDSAGIWLPPKDDFHSTSPSLDDIKAISISLLAPAFDALLFRKLPKIIHLPFEDVKWHYNPLCQNCRYESDCRSRAEREGELGSMPNISIEEANILRDLLRISRTLSPSKSSKHLTDIEEIHELIAAPNKLDILEKNSPSVLKRSKQILSVPKKRRVTDTLLESPVIEAARTKRLQVIPRLNYTCPRREDIAVVISIVSDPSSPNSAQDYFCVTPFSENNLTLPQAVSCSTKDIITNLANTIRSIDALRRDDSSKYTCQFYVWSPAEQGLLQSHIINAALTSSSNVDDIRLSIGSLAQGASLLQTTFQPLVLSGALLGFLGKGRQTKGEYQACLKRLGLSTEGTVDVLRKRIDNEILMLQNKDLCRKKEFGQLPRVLSLKKEVERQLALPIPGYWDLKECATMLLPSGDVCPTDEEVFAAYKDLDHGNLRKLLIRRNRLVYTILKHFRFRSVSSAGKSPFVNDAKALSVHFMDICKEPHIRKLFFMQQFEVLAKLSELWQSRIDGCPEAPLLEYCRAVKVEGTKIQEYVFRIVSGNVDVSPSDKDISFYDKLLVQETPSTSSSDLPVESLFDDLLVSGLVFPLNQYTRANWSKQHPRVQNELSVVEIRSVYADCDRCNTFLTLRIWGNMKVKLQEGLIFRLSPRLVDFNTTKILSALLQTDLLWGSSDKFCNKQNLHHDVPFLQLILDPSSFGKVSGTDQYFKTENDIQRLFGELKGLGNAHAGFLVLKASQRKATRRILNNRLSVIWGPPGTGKTYTISLSLLRLLEVEHRHRESRPKIVFITAYTHAAIEACRGKLERLMDAYRNIEDLPTEWLNNVKLELVSKGSEHPAPLKGLNAVNIYAGTIFQLSNFLKRHSMQVDGIIIDEAGQISLGSISLVLRYLSPEARIIIAGDSEQLAPIFSAQYPQLKFNALFGSVLDCLMFSSSKVTETPLSASPEDDSELSGSQSTIIQLTENFRLNPDLGEFVSTIYSRQFKPQKVQARQLSLALRTLCVDEERPSGIQPKILSAVRTFFVALSDVMYKQPQSVLVAPEVTSITPVNLLSGTSNIALTHRPVSLALIKMESWSCEPGTIVYESHVHAEAGVASALVFLLQKCCPNDDIFVATPHRIQREAVKAALGRTAASKCHLPSESAFERMHLGNNDSGGKVTVDTVERLQGSEASFVICLFSLPKSFESDLGFLLERRRLNVAISRAKTLCILVSSDSVLCPSLNVLSNEEAAKGYAFLKAFEKRAWTYNLPVEIANRNR